MMLRTPSCSMKAITFCCAPAPIDNMATTAATPKIMPSMVSRERSLCVARFSRPRNRSGSHCVSVRGSAKERVFMVGRIASFCARTQCRTRAAHFGLFGSTGFRINQRHHGARLEAFQDRASSAERADLDLLRFEASAALAINNLLAFALEHGFARDGYGVGKLVATDGQACGEAGAEPGVALIEKNGDIEFVRGVVVPEFMGGGPAHGLHFAGEVLSGQCIDLGIHGLAQLQVAAVVLRYCRDGFRCKPLIYCLFDYPWVLFVAHLL